MLVNHTTGEIAYHSLILKEKGGLEFKQYPLRNEEGRVEFIDYGFGKPKEEQNRILEEE